MLEIFFLNMFGKMAKDMLERMLNYMSEKMCKDILERISEDYFQLIYEIENNKIHFRR